MITKEQTLGSLDGYDASEWEEPLCFEVHALMIPVMPRNNHILEVKYDGVIPRFILSLLDTGSLERTSYSKYVYARDTMSDNGCFL